VYFTTAIGCQPNCSW